MEWLLSAVLIVIVLMVATVLGILAWNMVKKEAASQKVTQELLRQNTDLVNKLISSDIQTYSLMTGLANSSQGMQTSNDPYYPQSDEAEAARIDAMAGGVGLGSPLYDDPEQKSMLEDLTGFGLGDDESYTNGQR